MSDLVKRFPDEQGLKRRVLNQAAREVLLSQASDWPFIMKMGTTVPYAVKRVKEHIYNFNRIYENLSRNTVNTEWLTGIEKRTTSFPMSTIGSSQRSRHPASRVRRRLHDSIYVYSNI